MNQRQADTDAHLTSVELRFLFDCAIAARHQGKSDLSDVFVRAAEGLIRALLPDVAKDVGTVASRKGAGDQIAARIAQNVSPTAAAAIFVLWSFRGARDPAIRVLIETFGKHPVFQDTVRLLCHRVFAAQARSPSTHTAIEVAAPRCR